MGVSCDAPGPVAPRFPSVDCPIVLLFVDRVSLLLYGITSIVNLIKCLNEYLSANSRLFALTPHTYYMKRRLLS